MTKAKVQSIEKVEEQSNVKVEVQSKIMTVKDLCTMYNIDGKYIRRHIRNKFTIGGIRKVSGVNNATYSWNENDKQWLELVAYFDKLLKSTPIATK